MTVRLSSGTVTASVDAVRGGRLASLVIRGRERLIARPRVDADLPAISWGSFPMVPWVGRMRAGRLEWNGRTFDLARNLGGHAIHGTAFDRSWTVDASDERSVRMHCRIGDGDGWPFAADVSQVIELAPDEIRFRLEVRAEAAMPIAVGWHPWFGRVGDEPIVITVPSGQVLETTADLIPTGALVPVAGITDLRRAAAIGVRALDHAYVDVAGPSRLAWPDLELTIEADPLAAVVVHTTPTGVCIEPQTAWPDAVRLASQGIETGLVRLDPGATFSAASRWRWRSLETPGRSLDALGRT